MIDSVLCAHISFTGYVIRSEMYIMRCTLSEFIQQTVTTDDKWALISIPPQ